MSHGTEETVRMGKVKRAGIVFVYAWDGPRDRKTGPALYRMAMKFGVPTEVDVPTFKIGPNTWAAVSGSVPLWGENQAHWTRNTGSPLDARRLNLAGPHRTVITEDTRCAHTGPTGNRAVYVRMYGPPPAPYNDNPF